LSDYGLALAGEGGRIGFDIGLAATLAIRNEKLKLSSRLNETIAMNVALRDDFLNKRINSSVTIVDSETALAD